MNMNDSEALAEAARLWAIRVQDPAFQDWDGFTRWLEADARHLAAYEKAAEDAAWADATLATPQPAPPAAEPVRRPWKRLSVAAFGALAASVALVGSLTMLRPDPLQQIGTAPGEHRTVALADGSTITLNGGTRIRFDPKSPRTVTLDRGEALFHVEHDEARPFLVVASGARLLDVGTVFNVVAEGKAMQVAVAEGAVVFEPGPKQIRLDPGQTLALSEPGATPVVGKVDARSIGGWQEGRLQYENARLADVARDLSRNIGRPIHPSGRAEHMRFSGTLMVKGTPEQVLTRAAPLLGVKFTPQGEAWTMTPANAMSK
ncbi:FecR domain-containing protein [Sandaracinobacter sp. RS1-74]|uniref:FecR family protein n=1 Tax=Sandaracinobacteroides sayramensis TaxID=2913411 RepID=UPI001EDBBC76|nr:FecR domain-containing protein [Sandaracinobacteroides sayramensis]MCG2840514.1 FecR domain-containing protein [Sandaracinobacteroides sayramensis]